MKKIGIVRFLGTNCDRDVWQAVEHARKQPVWLWHEDLFDTSEFEAVVLAGGFSYGDYLRAGALAARSAVMKSVHEAARKGLPILGICNGFQILCETGLLPGALIRNSSLRFIDKWSELALENTNPFWGAEFTRGARIALPIAHGEGRFYAEEDTLKGLQDSGQIWWSYGSENPNGSLLNIAGVMNKNKNVAGLMPHPERAIFDWMGGTDGVSFFASRGTN